MKKIKGIDVSRWQGTIDWRNVAGDGIDFAMIKATQGESVTSYNGEPFTDSKFVANINGAAAAGLKCGVYHFMTSLDKKSAEKEMDYFFSAIEPYRKHINLYTAVDFEEKRYMDSSRKRENSELVHYFADRALDKGYTPMLYTNLNFMTYYLDMDLLSKIPIWEARYYTPRSDSKVPETKNLIIWQWNNQGRANGINGNVDLDIMIEKDDCREKYEKLLRLAENLKSDIEKTLKELSEM